jgi:hypothetical protein
MDKEVMHTYELFLGRYIINTGHIAKVIKYPYQTCGPSCHTGLKEQKVMFCTSCKHPEGHYCYIDYLTGLTYETKQQIPHWRRDERRPTSLL